MDITCYNCKKTWEVSAENLDIARLEFKQGAEEYSFTCPNCGTNHLLSEAEFRSYDHPQTVVPVTTHQSQPGASERRQPSKQPDSATSAPTNPVTAPEPGPQNQQGLVMVRGLETRRDHSTWSETMGSVNKGDRVTILDTWTDGSTTWAQLGPERWVTIQHNGERLIELIDD